MKRKVLIVEPSEVIVEGLKSTLHHADLRILDTETQVDELSERLDLLKPDILIINPTLYDNVTELRNGRNVAVVALVYQYVKQSRLRHFDAVIDIRDSRASILQAVLGLSAKTGAGDNALSNHELTRRETAVLVEVAKGLSNKEIASRLNVSVFTVTTHRKNIVRKTGIKSVAGLTVYALLNNLIDEDVVI
ncbi:MAG: LuxR C-terminal-related transcriptional regulator [Bacteroidales bacterium]|nr:LuxR C-terminal-related transcriptional regulator [Bacteroidales bacterium]MDY6412159.1 LuxR C-terminal-related transcriptional regulator [Bacteroidales bacterium]